ncbi:hypothetical protein D3C87_1200340 [compost metagenome]
MQDVLQVEQVLRRQQEDFTTVQVDVPNLVVLHDLQQACLEVTQVQPSLVTQLLRRQIAELTAQVAVVPRVYAEVNSWL